MIWVDGELNKTEGYKYDDLYDDSSKTVDKLYKDNVKISLINSSGKTVKTTTTTSGTYSINTGIKVTSSTSIASALSGYYLKLEYSNKYDTVVPNFDEINGSKALPEDDDGVAYIYNLSDYIDKDKFYSSYTLSNMNMGLIEVKNSEYSMTQNIDYVKVVINGYTYTYKYGKSGDTTKTAAPTVNYQGTSAFSRSIYPSDIAYSNAKEWDEDSIKIYVVYRIDIENEEERNYGKKKSETTSAVSYVEVDLKVTNLTNTFDTDRYELETSYDKSKNSDFENWKDNKDGTATYKGDKLNSGVVPNKPRTIYIQFKVKKEAIQKLLTKKESYEKIPTTAKAEAYHNYWKAYWSGKKPTLKFRDKVTDTYAKTASAYYLRLTLNTERTITGTVFEDENIYSTGEVLGDGMYGNKKDDSKENAISNVKVELISANGNKAKLYSSSNDYNEKDAETTSGVDGTYALVGVTPGKYYVRFTYGDGTQKICSLDTNSNQYKETENKVSLADYKSTTANESCIQSALGYKFENGFKAGEEWYKHTSHSNNNANKLYSTAVDNLEQRAKYNNDKTSMTNIQANTALMSIGVENTEETTSTVTKTFENDMYKETILGINFGIIDIPEVSLAFDKVISNIKIINAQGNILAEGNPASKNVKYVSDLDEGSHIVNGSQYIKAEITETELYGSTLKLTYSITIQNNSEVDYYEEDNSKYYGYYYMFGDSDNSKEVTLKVDNVLDYIDPVIKYENISIDDKHSIAQEKESDNQTITEQIQAKTNLSYDYVVNITNWKALNTTKHINGGSKVYDIDETQDTAEMTVTKLLSTDDDDLGVSNVAQVIKIADTPTLVETVDSSERYFNDPVYTNPTDEVYAVITPPTGADKLTTIIYVIVEIIGLSVITAGIVLIKKKVLNK